MSKFLNHLKSMCTDGKSLSDVVKEKINMTIEFNNNNPYGLYIFEPGKDYEESFDRYMSLPHRLKMPSDRECSNIWHVSTNMELFNMWHDHITGIGRDAELKLMDASNELLKDKDPIRRSDISALLTPYEIMSKGAYSDDKENNYYKVFGEIDTLDGSEISVKDWYNAYKTHVARVSSELWEKYYFAWKNTIIRLNNDLKDLDLDMNARLRKCQSLLELGWIPDVEFKEANLILNNINKEKHPIDISDIHESVDIDPDSDVMNRTLFMLYINDNNNTKVPYITTDFNTMYGANLLNSKVIRYNMNTLVRSFDVVTILAFVSRYDIKDELATTIAAVSVDPTADVVENQVVVEKELNANSILSMFMHILPINNIEMIRLMYGDFFVLYKDTRYEDIDGRKIYKMLSLTKVEESCEGDPLEMIAKNPTALNLYKYRSLVEATLSGYNYDYFQLLCENVLGNKTEEDIILKTINENTLLADAAFSAINEASIGDDRLVLEFTNKLKVLNEAESKGNLAYTINSEIEDKLYNHTLENSTRYELYKIRKEVLDILESCLKSGESIDMCININEDVHIDTPIHYKTNLLK